MSIATRQLSSSIRINRLTWQFRTGMAPMRFVYSRCMAPRHLVRVGPVALMRNIRTRAMVSVHFLSSRRVVPMYLIRIRAIASMHFLKPIHNGPLLWHQLSLR